MNHPIRMLNIHGKFHNSMDSRYWDAIGQSVGWTVRLTKHFASSDPATRIKLSPYTKFFSSFHCRNQSAKNADLCDAVAASLQCTDPRYLFVYPISLMTLRATFIITGVGSTRRIKFPDGAVTAWLSVWPRTYSCKRSHVLLQWSVLTAAQQLSIT